VTRQPHDQFAKSLLSEFLNPWGQVEISREVSDEPRFIDLYFQPNPQQDPSPLGLLGRMTQTPCLLEPYRNPVTVSQIRACLLKTLILTAQQERSSPQQQPPFLWILTPTASKRILKQSGAEPRTQWPRGIYTLADALQTAMVVIHHLPKEPDTLWLRLLGRGRVQQQAIDEVLALAEADPMALRVLELLLNWKIMLDEQQEALKAEERELVMNLSPAYLKWKEETLQQGIQEGKAQLLLQLLELKVGSLPAEVDAQIRSLSVDSLELLAERVLDLNSLPDLIQWLEIH
jgi:hypothetical protein